jgi:hypothetical protein
MKNQFDELAKGLAQSVTRRAALKKFGVGLAGMALALLGLGKAEAAKPLPATCCAYSCYAPDTNYSQMQYVCVPLGSTCPPPQKFCGLVGQYQVANCNKCK